MGLDEIQTLISRFKYGISPLGLPTSVKLFIQTEETSLVCASAGLKVQTRLFEADYS